jgi:uncharacterized protein YjdB
MKHDLEITNHPNRRSRWVMLGAAALMTLSCSSSTETTDPGSNGVAAVVVTPPSSTIAVGAQLPLQAQVQDAAGKILPDAPIVWSVKDVAIASVSANGVVTALAVGTTQVAANSNGKSGIAAITVNKTPVASVVVRPTHVDAVAGSKTPLTAIAYDAAQNPLTGRAITWTSSNQSVATVDATGMVTAVAAGSATITGTSEGKSDAATVSVTQGPITTVVVTPDSVSMFATQTTQLAATGRDATGAAIAGTTFIWSSSNTSVASVSSNGVVTAVSTGTATITATSNGHSGTATVIVTSVPVATVTVSPPAVFVPLGTTTALTATMKDANGNVLVNRAVTWSSSNDQIATVSPSGVVTTVAQGTVTITATSEGKTGTATVSVGPPSVASVTVSPATTSVNVGQTTSLTATPKDANGVVLTGRIVTWASSNTALATVSATGVVTGVAVGSVTITATSEGRSGTATVTIASTVSSVTVAPTTVSVDAGLTTTLVATVKNLSGTVVTDRVVTWTTSNAATATVSSTGVVTGVSPGTATITATSEGKSGSSTVTVLLVPVGSVTIAPTTSSVAVGQTTTLTATVKDRNGTVVTDRVVTWVSVNPGIATVSSTGVVTGVAPGTTTITATSETKSGSATVTVTLAPVATVTVSPPTATVVVLGTTTLTTVLKDANGNVLTGRVVTWSSSNPLVATVSSAGVVSGVIPGTATITATSEGKSGTSVITVTLAPVATVTVAPASASVASGSTAQFTATLKDANGNVLTGRTVTWASSNTGVATVSSSGLSTALLVGTATITATSEGKSGSGTISVTPGPLASVQVSPPSASMAVNGTAQLSATALDAQGNTITGLAFSWQTSNGTVATVSSGGLVTGKKAGTATITAVTGTKSGTSAITVTP